MCGLTLAAQYLAQNMHLQHPRPVRIDVLKPMRLGLSVFDKLCLLQVAGVAAAVKCIVGNLIFLDEIAFCSIKMSTTNLKGWMLSYCQKL